MRKPNITHNVYLNISGIKFISNELQSTEIPNFVQLKNAQRDLFCQVRFMTKLFSTRNYNIIWENNIVKRIFRKWDGSTDWIGMAQNKE
jgi:hypothetical protein